MGEKVKIEELNKTAEKEILRKRKNNQQQDIDEEVLSMISLCRQGVPKYKREAMNWLAEFYVNAGYVENKKDIIKV